ncbi:MAG: peptide chain release factor-like protein [candidate division WOR-3 bacterium]|nr:peptide chain release factor-like protein [candidate division WOR-3 bacterium]
MAGLGAGSEKEAALAARLAGLGVKPEDLVEKFIRAGGPGGQNVNKTSTAVYLKHLPSGIEVKMQQERSQALNRFLARRTLADKLEARLRGARNADAARVAKLRKQKRKRSRRAQEKVLVAKHLRADRKAARTLPDLDA